MIVAAPAPTMTEDEFLARHGGELGVDLIDGQVVRYPMPGFDHGRVCSNAGFEFETFARQTKLGRTCTNDTFVRIRDGTLRGVDVGFWSYVKMPAGERPSGVAEVPPEVVVEVKSPTDLWTDLFGKVVEYLRAGVAVVVVLDPKTASASAYRPGERQDVFEKDEVLTIPDVLPGFAVPVARFFEE